MVGAVNMIDHAQCRKTGHAYRNEGKRLWFEFVEQNIVARTLLSPMREYIIWTHGLSWVNNLFAINRCTVLVYNITMFFEIFSNVYFWYC